MRVSFTEHAIDRFIERRMPNSSREAALREMMKLFEIGTPLKEKTSSGDSQMLADGVLFVLKHDRDGRADCATVLFDLRSASTNQLAEEIERHGAQPLEPVGAPLRRRRRSRRSNKW